MRTKRWSSGVRASSTAERAVKGPVLRSTKSKEMLDKALNRPYVVNIGILKTLLKECTACQTGPLDMTNIIELRPQGVCPVLKVRCTRCSAINTLHPAECHQAGKRGPPVFDANSRASLGALHSGMGHTHYSGFLSTIGLPSLTPRNFKKRERESGIAIEEVAQKSCNNFTEVEKELSQSGQNDKELPVKVGVSYDMGWRKRGRRHDSSSGSGAAIGLKTGKVLSYATRNTMCRVCQDAAKTNKELKEHNCRRNHTGSSKSMEANVAVQVFTEAVDKGVQYSIYVGDDDSTTESRLKTLVTYDIDKWSDINHCCRTLGSCMYASKSKVKGLTPTVITYLQKCFTYCIKQNAGDPESLQEGLTRIVPHAFGEHEKCKAEWCRYKKDAKNYRHSDLPGGRDLMGSDLRAALEDAFLPFLTKQAAEKMAPCGSSQRNECLNSIIGSKAPKIRHYGGSESADFRTAAGTAQFNEGVTYLAEAAEIMGLAPNTTTEKYLSKVEKKRKEDRKRKSNQKFKKARRKLCKKKSQKTRSLEASEGVTYESGIAMTNTDISNAITNGTLIDLKASLTREEFDIHTKSLSGQTNQLGQDEQIQQQQDKTLLVFDTETTGLDRQAEILQISCMSVDEHSFSRYLFPEERVINESASKIHGLSVEYRSGKKLLVKNETVVPAVPQEQGMTEFCNFLKEQEQPVILVAHNGNRFDFPILLNSMKRHNLLDLFLGCRVMLVDSLNVFSNEMKRKNSPLKSCKTKTLSGLYEFIFEETFNAHDAQQDVAALARILFHSPLHLPLEDLLSSAVTGEEFVYQILDAKSRKSTLQRLPISDGMKDKLGRAGLHLKMMEETYAMGGARALLTVLALPEKFDQIYNKIIKPRVTKSPRVLTQIINFFQ